MTYYQIGTIINKRKEWGNKYIRRLSEDLKDYGKGYSYDQLKRMSRFASIFTEDEIRARPVPQIPWRSIIEIMNKSSSKEEISRCKNCTTKNDTTKSEQISRSKILTTMQTKGIRGGRVYLPYAFTEQGIYMLMTVLKTTNSQN